MRSIFLSILLGLVIGWSTTSVYYSSKITKQELKTLEAIKKKEKEYADKNIEWQAKLDKAHADSSTPNIVYRVRTESCVPDTRDSGLDDGASTIGTTRLGIKATESVNAVVEETKAQYRECSHRLRAMQEILSEQGIKW